VLRNFGFSGRQRGSAGLTGEAKLAGGSLGEELVGELEGGSGAGGDGGEGEEAAEGEQARGLIEAEADAELAGGCAEDAAAEGGVEGAETLEFEGYGGRAGSGGDGAAAPTDGFAGEEELGEETAKFHLPTGFFFAGELGEVGEGLVEGGILLAEEGEDGVADAVAGEGGVGVGGVFAPGLVERAEVGFDLGAGGLEEGAKDLSFGQGDDGVDGAEAFGPGSAEELHEDGLGLVVAGVGGEDGVGLAGGEEGGEEVVTDGAGGFFCGFGISSGARFFHAVGDAGLVEVERDVESGAEGPNEVLVGVGLGGAESVVDVDGGEAYTECVVLGLVGGMEREQEGYGVGSAGDGDAEAVAGFDGGAVEGERDGSCHELPS
jgi:hypothetical protein